LVYNNFYRVERCGAAALADGGGPFGLDILLALLFDDLVRAYEPDSIVECGSSFGDTTVYLAHRYPEIPIVSCDIDPLCAAIASHRTMKHPHVSVCTEQSVEIIEQTSRKFIRSIYFLDAHGAAAWPILEELSLIKSGVVVVHDFDIGHSRFAFDRYDGVNLDGQLLAKVLSAGRIFYQSNPIAETPFPCLQTGRRTGVAVVPYGAPASAACAAVAREPRHALVPRVIS
jgi:hypothetical protein